MRLNIANPNQFRLQQRLAEQVRRRPQLMATIEAELRFLKVMRKSDADFAAQLERVLSKPRVRDRINEILKEKRHGN
jgi:hypothetical protein